MPRPIPQRQVWLLIDQAGELRQIVAIEFGFVLPRRGQDVERAGLTLAFDQIADPRLAAPHDLGRFIDEPVWS